MSRHENNSLGLLYVLWQANNEYLDDPSDNRLDAVNKARANLLDDNSDQIANPFDESDEIEIDYDAIWDLEDVNDIHWISETDLENVTDCVEEKPPNVISFEALDQRTKLNAHYPVLPIESYSDNHHQSINESFTSAVSASRQLRRTYTMAGMVAVIVIFMFGIGLSLLGLADVSSNSTNEPLVAYQVDMDQDDDGIVDSDDNCPTVWNADQADLDGDGTGDVCEADVDGDSIRDYADNCPIAFNPNQFDSNVNDVGDVCELDTGNDIIYNYPYIDHGNGWKTSYNNIIKPIMGGGNYSIRLQSIDNHDNMNNDGTLYRPEWLYIPTHKFKEPSEYNITLTIDGLNGNINHVCPLSRHKIYNDGFNSYNKCNVDSLGNIAVADSKFNECILVHDGDIQSVLTCAHGVYTHAEDGFMNHSRDQMLFHTTSHRFQTFLDYEYDELGRVIESTDSIGNKWFFEYDLTGNLIQQTDARRVVTNYTYDEIGRLVTVIDGLGNRTTFEYDHRNLLTETKPNGTRTIYRYDVDDRLIQQTDTVGIITHYNYDELNRLMSIQNEELGMTEYEFDRRGNMVAIYSPNGHHRSFEYDATNRITQMTYPNDTSMQFEYSDEDQLISVFVDPTQGGETRYIFDYELQTVTKIDELGDQVDYVYDNLGNVIQIHEDDKITEYTYDAVGNLVSMIDPDGNTTVYSYDAVGSLTEFIDALGNRTTYEYDEVGNLIQIVDATGYRIDYHYDANRNLIAITDPNGNLTEFEYDARIRPIIITDTDDSLILHLVDNSCNELDCAGFLNDVRYSGVMLGDVVVWDQRQFRMNGIYGHCYMVSGSTMQQQHTGSHKTLCLKFDNHSNPITEDDYDERSNMISLTDKHGIFVPYNASSDNSTTIINEGSVPQQIVIQFEPSVTIQERQAYVESIGGTVISSIDVLDTMVISIPETSNPDTLPQSDLTLSYEPDYYVSALDSIETPTNDPYYNQQWALEAIDVGLVWEALPDDLSTISIAVIDSGICIDHPDLIGRVLEGYDFVENDSTPQDELGHGCGVAGVIAGNINNGIGIAGIAPNAQIMPLRVLGPSGIGTYSDVASAIVYAVDHGADIINLSLGGSNPSNIIENAVDYAATHGTKIIAAAGNTGENTPLYPARYEAVVSVGALDKTGEIASFSNKGADVYAPGVNIMTLSNDGEYATHSGTSFATPYIVGLISLENNSESAESSDVGIVIRDDDLDSSIVVTSLPFKVTNDVTRASFENNNLQSNCGYNDGAIIWYKYTPSTNQNINISTIGSNYDTVLSVWTGTQGDLVEVACNDQYNNSNQSSLQYSLTAGVSYYILVSAYDDTDGGVLQFELSEYVPYIAPSPTEAIVTFAEVANENDDYWHQTQTIPPIMYIASSTPSEISVTWKPISFTDNNGAYEISCPMVSDNQNGEYDCQIINNTLVSISSTSRNNLVVVTYMDNSPTVNTYSDQQTVIRFAPINLPDDVSITSASLILAHYGTGNEEPLIQHQIVPIAPDLIQELQQSQLPIQLQYEHKNSGLAFCSTDSENDVCLGHVPRLIINYSKSD